MRASLKNNANIVRKLLQKKADVNIKDSNGKTALDFAVAKGHDEIVKLLQAVEIK